MLFAGLKRGKNPFVIVADDMDDAGYIYHDLCQIAGEESCAILPSGYKRSIKYGQSDPPSRILRTEALDAFVKQQTRWVVTYPEALAEKVPAPQRIKDAMISLHVG
jgi:transcription-repair coupling factor (superfamily II helicase)